MVPQVTLEQWDHPIIQLNRGDCSRALQKFARQDADPGTDFHNVIVRLDVGGCHDDLENIFIDENMLPEIGIEADAAVAQKIADAVA